MTSGPADGLRRTDGICFQARNTPIDLSGNSKTMTLASTDAGRNAQQHMRDDESMHAYRLMLSRLILFRLIKRAAR